MIIEPSAESPPHRRNVGHFLLRVPIIFIDECALVIALLLLLKWLVGEQWEIVALGNSFLPLLLVLALLLFPVALLRRRWSIVLILLPAVVFFALSYGVCFLPRSVPADPQAVQMKLLTYNIHSEQAALEPITALIRDSGADVVAVQELSSEAAAHFAKALMNVYPYQAFHTKAGEPVIGQGVLSRYPFTSDDYWRNESLPLQLGHQRVQIDLKDTRVTLYNAHPIHPILKDGHLFYTALRSQEIDSVLQRAAQDTGPVIIVGDFNMADQADDYHRVTVRYADVYREVGWGLGPTFPDFSSPNAVPGGRTSLPIPLLVRLDYVFRNRAVQAVEAKVWPSSGGSDHRPVFTQLALLNN